MAQISNVRLVCALFLAVQSASAQTNAVNQTNKPLAVLENTFQTNSDQSIAEHFENIRMACIDQRRIICGKILKVLPEGIVVDSGYANLMREPLNQSWLIPGNAVASRATNVVEENKPDAICIGQVFLTDLPKPPPGRKLKVFDYVILEGFPTGQFTYNSVGDLKRTVRKFSTKIAASIRWKAEQEEKEKTAPSGK